MLLLKLDLGIRSSSTSRLKTKTRLKRRVNNVWNRQILTEEGELYPFSKDLSEVHFELT